MLTVRMNWMDADRSQSADVQLSKDSKDIPVYHRNKLYHHRAQVASVIRHQLAVIQRELNGDANSDQTEEARATEAITALIKGQRYRDGKLYTCYMDGTSHEGCETVRAYNSYCRQRLDAFLEENTDITALVPDASEFDVSPIEDLINEDAALGRSGDADTDDDRASLRKQIDSARTQYNAKALKCSRYLTSFVGIRNARLSEGFDPSSVVVDSSRSPSHSVAAPQAEEEDNFEVVNADGSPDVDVLVSDADEDDKQYAAEEEEEAAAEEAEQESSDFIRGHDSEGQPPNLRDGTVALDATGTPSE